MNSRRTRLRSALAVILTISTLVPAGVLFGRVVTDNLDRRDSTRLEQQGVQYLVALSPLVSALAEAESSALQGVPTQPASLAAALTQVSAADARLGRALRTTQRLAGLREHIGKLPKVTGGPLAVYQAHVEATDLTLALYQAIRRTSQLTRDPDSDLSNLQQAVTVDMPTSVVLVNRMGDLANLLQNATGATRAQVSAAFGQQVVAVQDTVDRLTDNLQIAVDNTRSRTLSGGLVTALDTFRRGIESMTRGANPGGTPNVATMAVAQSSLQTALTALAGVTLNEMARLLDDRMATLDQRRVEAYGMAALAVVLVVGALAVRPRARRRDPAAEPVGESTREIAIGRPPGGRDSGQHDRPPARGAVEPTRERSGALR